MIKRRRKRGNKAKKRSLNINFKEIVILIFSVCVVGYTVFFAISFTGIVTVDPTVSNGSQYYLLSQMKDSFESTLWIFEKGEGGERKIDKVYVHVYNKEKEKSLLIYLPEWLYFSGLEEDFGNAVAVSSFRYAGDFIQEGRGVEYTLWQISQMLGIKVDNYIWFSTEAITLYEDIYGELAGSTDSLLGNYTDSERITDDFLYLNRFFKQYSITKTYFKLSAVNDFKELIYSNMGFTNVLTRIGYDRRIFSNVSTHAIDLGYAGYSLEEMSDVGGMVNYFNSSVFDKEYRGIISTMIDRDLEKERVRVEVYNGSGVSGAARQFGRKVENSGCDVVRYENAPKIVEKTIIYVPNVEDFDDSLNIVKETLSGTYELVEGRASFMTTGDIVIVLGEDIKQMYSF